jgi:hypothetical protein
MAAGSGKLNSILKDLSGGKTAAASPRDVAVHHATILQHRKDLETEILDNVILLSEFPLERCKNYSAQHPAASDAAAFKSRVRLFQPSDYDDMVEERNVNDLCGYALCPNPRPNPGRGGEWAFGSRGEIVKRKELATWCSQDCKKRTLYVKVQLNENAAWERAGMPEIQIDLLDDDKNESEADKTAKKLEELKLEEQRQAVRDSAALALERGDTSVGSQQSKVKVQLKEKQVKPPSNVEDFGQDDDDAMAIEGYTSKLGPKAVPE